MRETLHQLTLALALPITVGAVWIARGDRIEPVVRERATAYRVELGAASAADPRAAALARPPDGDFGAPFDAGGGGHASRAACGASGALRDRRGSARSAVARRFRA